MIHLDVEGFITALTNLTSLGEVNAVERGGSVSIDLLAGMEAQTTEQALRVGP
jgi:hypothetical protein